MGLALGVAGCFGSSETRFVDVARHTDFPAIKEAKADGEVLRITVVQDGGAVFCAGIQPQVIEGNVYLRPVCISSVVRATEFSVDLSDAKFPRDWKQRLYWIEAETISSPITPPNERVREIRRSKIVVE